MTQDTESKNLQGKNSQLKCFMFTFLSQHLIYKQSKKNQDIGTSLVVQWLRLCAPNARDLGSIPGRGTRSHLLQLKIAQ